MDYITKCKMQNYKISGRKQKNLDSFELDNEFLDTTAKAQSKKEKKMIS